MPDTQFEVLPSVESGPSIEHQPEQSAVIKQAEQPQPVIQLLRSTAPTAEGSLPRKDPQILLIEGFLSEGLDEAYLSMTTAKRLEFRARGEATAVAIQTLMSQGKATVHKVRALIMKWLQMIPGVNRFFLEQEAKIKTDQILKS